MELYSVTENQYQNTKLIFKVTGNSRLRVLNDYELGLIDKTHIYYRNGSLYLEVVDPHHIFPINYAKYYLQFDYIDKMPHITNVINYNDYIPYNMLYTITSLKKSTYDDFNILEFIPIDKHELQQYDMPEDVSSEYFSDTDDECEVFDEEAVEIVDQNETSDTENPPTNTEAPLVQKQKKQKNKPRKKINYPNIINRYGVLYDIR